MKGLVGDPLLGGLEPGPPAPSLNPALPVLILLHSIISDLKPELRVYISVASAIKITCNLIQFVGIYQYSCTYA